ncbi:hypothetical protein ABB37_08587 [Leptomonas pyrrhocoris]|uniref:Transmembrane protein n=1 Tax=Leptomonas pyrrhocoris TaxID=157538 RepID=A0A0M9FT20_LEPPY|nr:hypothetical protein ABB37_08587 [Leptomonas pyrrhocoris]KPA75286.1 hypothetical protein ABB37_08587 [Leptomonas pyrrhocoris]|eukprot:XP_015653725.1 hypothetical protein ABB37_08587 [Leptomonas pyrrhocoris]
MDAYLRSFFVFLFLFLLLLLLFFGKGKCSMVEDRYLLLSIVVVMDDECVVVVLQRYCHFVSVKKPASASYAAIWVFVFLLSRGILSLIVRFSFNMWDSFSVLLVFPCLSAFLLAVVMLTDESIQAKYIV